MKPTLLFIAFNIAFKTQKNEHMSIMPTHPHQASVTRILKSSPACQNSHFFNGISALPNISMNAVFFASQIEIWEAAFENCSHTYPIDKDMSFIDILTYMTFTISFSLIVFATKILLLRYRTVPSAI